MKEGISTMHKYQEIPMRKYVKMSLKERTERHALNYPNDLNERRVNTGVTWSKRTQKHKALDSFYKTHVYTWISEGKKAWVRVAENDKGEEE
jgi:hypothetical protein